METIDRGGCACCKGKIYFFGCLAELLSLRAFIGRCPDSFGLKGWLHSPSAVPYLDRLRTLLEQQWCPFGRKKSTIKTVSPACVNKWSGRHIGLAHLSNLLTRNHTLIVYLWPQSRRGGARTNGVLIPFQAQYRGFVYFCALFGVGLKGHQRDATQVWGPNRDTHTHTIAFKILQSQDA